MLPTPTTRLKNNLTKSFSNDLRDLDLALPKYKEYLDKFRILDQTLFMITDTERYVGTLDLL